MAYRFKRKESIAAGFARIASEQIDDAVTVLEKSPKNGVHEARKSIKRLRGLLRLFRRALPDGSYERENAALRAAAHTISRLRDAQVRIAVFDSIASGIKAPGVALARRKLLAAFKEVAASGPGSASPVQATITALRSVGARLPGLKPDSGWSVLRRGLKFTYRRARKAHADAHAERTTAAIHLWRRRSKDFGYQMELLRKIDPAAMKRRIRTANEVTDLLGSDHDLAVLDQTLAAAHDLPSELREKLAARIARRRKKLQRRAFEDGSELFFEKPAVVVKELGRQWKRWRRGDEAK
ncbi:MAG: CHAD domain-containing protein [Chthoniobacteraceae bacterium]